MPSPKIGSQPQTPRHRVAPDNAGNSGTGRPSGKDEAVTRPTRLQTHIQKQTVATMATAARKLRASLS